jgi:endonuclease-3
MAAKAGGADKAAKTDQPGQADKAAKTDQAAKARAGARVLSGYEFVPRPKKEIEAILSFFRRTYPDAKCGLNFKNSYELLMATILSAQCQDKTVNLATGRLFVLFPDAKSLARADLAQVEESVKICGFYRQKAKSLVECALSLVERFGGEVPPDLEELVTLKGVGRKTANVVLGEAFGVPGLTVDTHVKRISGRLNLTASQSPDQIELDLMEQIPKDYWIDFSRQVIAHGRTICFARSPLCAKCDLTLCQARVAK